MKTPKLRPFVRQLLTQRALTAIQQLKIYFLVASERGVSQERGEVDDIVARYFEMYQLPARDIFHVVDALQTAAALVQGQSIYLPYFLPLLISKQLSPNGAELAKPRLNAEWEFVYHDRNRAAHSISPWTLALKLDSLFKLPWKQFNELPYDDEMNRIAGGMKAGMSGLSDPSNYGQLIEAVGRFDSPTPH